MAFNISIKENSRRNGKAALAVLVWFLKGSLLAAIFIFVAGLFVSKPVEVENSRPVEVEAGSKSRTELFPNAVANYFDENPIKDADHPLIPCIKVAKLGLQSIRENVRD